MEHFKDQFKTLVYLAFALYQEGSLSGEQLFDIFYKNTSNSLFKTLPTKKAKYVVLSRLETKGAARRISQAGTPTDEFELTPKGQKIVEFFI